MENVEKIESLLKTAKAIKEGIPSYREKIKDPDCDKYGIGFNIDDRFSSVKLTISVDSKTGYYGSSSCSTYLSIPDQNAFKQHFIKYLNAHFDEIMFDVANRIKKEALEYKEKAELELQEKLNKLKEL